jgi:acyl-coenzyme A synthetase/AMP-(fatty) acid ligase
VDRPDDVATTVPAFLRRVTDAHGPKEAIVTPDERITYAGLAEQSARLARGLLRRGVGKGTRVGILLPNGPRWAVTWLALARIGAVGVPVSTFSRARELRSALTHADLQGVVTATRVIGRDMAAELEEAFGDLGRSPELCLSAAPYLRWIVMSEPAPDWARGERWLDPGGVGDEALATAESAVMADDPVTVLYTSGSTAAPKGAVHGQRAPVIQAGTFARFIALDPDDRLYSPVPFFWVGGLAMVLLGALGCGATVVTSARFSPGEALELLSAERVTRLVMYPHHRQQILDDPGYRATDLSSLRFPSAELEFTPGVRRSVPGYGSTETFGNITQNEPGDPSSVAGSMGPPTPGTEVLVAGPDGRPVEDGVVGEILVRGPTILQGLYKEDRRRWFTPDGYYRTGDLGYRNGGALWFVARQGEMVKTAGANVAPGEVEEVLVALEGVQAAWVVGLDDPVRGTTIAAAVVLEPGATATPEELRRQLHKELSSFKVPRVIRVVDESSLQWTASGKVQLPALKSLLAGTGEV